MSYRFIKTYMQGIWETLSFRLFPLQSVKPQTASARFLLQNHSGQTLVEYVLLLVVILSLAYGLARNFFEPLQRYGTSVFSSTIACSLEYGQLPAEITSEEGCDASLQAGQLSASRPGSSHRRSSSSTSQNENSNNQNSKSSSSTPIASSDSSSGGGNRSAPVSSRSNGLSLPSNQGSESRGLAKNEVMVESSAVRSELGDDSMGRRSRKPLYKPLSGELEAYLQQKKKSSSGDAKRTLAGVLDSNESKAKKFTVKTKQTAKVLDDSEEAWDISRILRIALMLLMIFAILIFVFFQVAQIRKGSS